ncbi:hypothetical protein MUK42_12980 [Musa troglodytarum]|uniref:KIB1-4 beta-propeller domain-containing protein n=1 Tax=Musa troglodytarum TaxID=320322 RepID=A0A9E7HF31_9LILI|nr:hypothetical protein MUK42_12980 [Musa troglodytarum]
MNVMEMILKHLTIVDHIRVGAVCKSWWSTNSTINFLPDSRAPWLVVSPSSPAPRRWSLCPISNGRRSFGMEIPEAFQSQWCCGSSKGWLTFSHNPPEVFLGSKAHLLNPITGATLDIYPCSHHIVKSIISTSPLAEDCLFITLGYRFLESYKSVNVHKLRHHSIKTLEIDDQPTDIMFHRGRLYVLTDSAKIKVYTFKPHHHKVLVIPIPFLNREGDRHSSSFEGRLVGSDGDVFVVYYNTDLRSELQQLKVFKVRKERGLRRRVVEVNSLGGCTFFIGGFSEGVSVSNMKSSLESELIKSDCIYYRRRVKDNLRRYCMQTGRTVQVAGLEVAGDLLGWFTPKSRTD